MTTYTLTVQNPYFYFGALGLSRVPGAILSFAGVQRGDNGERIATVARKSGAGEFYVTETQGS